VSGLDLDALEGLTGELTADELADLAGYPETPGPAPRRVGTLTQPVTVTLEGGEQFDVVLDARDRRAYALFADRYNLPAFTLDTEGGADVLRLELLTVFSAWHATRYRLKLHRMEWAAWNAAVIDVAVRPNAPEVAPHPPGRGADSWPS
jgi:hypothetical protein